MHALRSMNEGEKWVRRFDALFVGAADETMVTMFEAFGGFARSDSGSRRSSQFVGLPSDEVAKILGHFAGRRRSPLRSRGAAFSIAAFVTTKNAPVS